MNRLSNFIRRKEIFFARFYFWGCFALLTANLIYLTIVYMRYAVDTKIGPFIPLIQPYPKLSLCFNLNTLLSGKVSSYFFDREDPKYLNKSAGELFAATPKVEDMAKDCLFRDTVTDELVQVTDGAKCAGIFSIKKFRMQSYMCYMLDFSLQKEYDVYAVTHSLVDPRFLYSVTVNEPLDFGHSIIPLIHFEEIPNDDRVFTEEYFPSARANDSLILTYYLLDVERLQAPYENKCQVKSKVTCYYDCINEIHHKKGITPTFGMVRNEPQLHHLKVPNYFNKNDRIQYDQSLKESIKKCKKMCPYDSCRQKLVKTLFSEPFSSPNMTLEIETSSSPILRLEETVKFEVVDYINQCLGLAGIWVGFSFFSLLNWRPKSKGQKSKWPIGSLNKLSAQVMRLTQMFNTFVRRVHFQRRPIYRVRAKSKNTGCYRSLRPLSLIFKSVIFALLIFQLFEVVRYYTMYDTMVLFRFDINPEVEEYPHMIICFAIDDLFHSKKQKYETVEESNFHRILTMRDSNINRTLDDLIESSIGMEMIHGCRFRNWTDFFWKFQLHSAEYCRSQFTLNKFYYDRNICYNFFPLPKMKEKSSQARLKLVTTNPGILYSIILNPLVASINKHRLLLISSHYTPLYSIEYTALIAKRSHRPRINLLTSNRRRTIQLPRPYNTRCNYFESVVYCKTKCYNEIRGVMNRIPYNLIVQRSTSRANKQKILTYSDLLNASVNSYWRQLEDKCDKRCQSELCDYAVTQTYASNYLNRPEFDTEYIVGMAAYPGSTSESIARLSWYDLYYQTFCSLSFWLGFSFIASDPIQVCKSRQIETLINSLSRKVSIMKRFLSSLNPGVFQESVSNVTVTCLRWNIRRKLTLAVILKVTIAFFCFVMCICHVVLSSLPYFAYPTVIECSQEPEGKTNFTFTICINTFERLMENKFSNSKQIQLDSSYLANVTVRQLFDLLPPTDQVFHRCAFWKLSKDKDRPADLRTITDRIFFHHTNLSLCSSLFYAHKILISNKLCYRMYPRNPTNWNRNQMLNTITDQKYLFMIGISTSLLTNSYSLIISSDFDYPYMSFVHSPRILKSNYSNNWNLVTYSRYQQVILLPPYQDAGFTHMYYTRCVVRCFEVYFSRYNLTFFGQFDEPTDSIKFITTIDRKSSMFNSIIGKVRKECQSYCSNQVYDSYFDKIKLAHSYTVTRFIQAQQIQHIFHPYLNITEFYIRSSSNPVFITNFKIAISFCDLIINIGSVISVWFGLSAIAVNPFAQVIDRLTPHPEISELVADVQKIESILAVKRKNTRNVPRIETNQPSETNRILN